MPEPRWDLSPREAVAEQRRLATRVVTGDSGPAPRLIAGIDAGFPDSGTRTRVAASVCDLATLEVLETVVVEGTTRFPYVPGLLSFREVPLMLEALAQLVRQPDVVLVDGQGLAHPRRFGSACHLGVLSGRRTVGVAKSRLCGRHREPGARRGSRTQLVDGDEVLGKVLRTRTRVKPLYVSCGHRVSLDTACALVLACAPRYRLPEPIRVADRLASRR